MRRLSAGAPARIAHPVVWIGKLIATLEQRWNDSAQRRGAQDIGIHHDADRRRQCRCCRLRNPDRRTATAVRNGHRGPRRDHGPGAAKSLHARTRCAATSRARRPSGSARSSVEDRRPRYGTAHVVRVAAAAIESLAESFNDGIVAPAFWLAIGGLPGLFAYKALNTADSLIGHREQRWRAFGWAAARADDVANLVPARLAGLPIVVAGGGGLRVMWRMPSTRITERGLARGRDGWCALGVELGGAATYDGVMHERRCSALVIVRRTATSVARCRSTSEPAPCSGRSHWRWLSECCCGRADDPGLRLGRRQVAAGRGTAGCSRTAARSCDLQAAEHVEQCGRHRDGRRDRPLHGAAGAGVPHASDGRHESCAAQAAVGPGRAAHRARPAHRDTARRRFRARSQRPAAVALDSFRGLQREADIVIVEGAGSPAETNLRARHREHGIRTRQTCQSCSSATSIAAT